MTSTTTTDGPTVETSEPSHRRRSARILALTAVLAVVAGVVLWRLVGQQPEVPYDDPQAGGLLTLCSAHGDPVTGGSVDDRPFAAAVVGTEGLPGDVEPAGAVASLFAYQPREGIAPAEFSGIALASPVSQISQGEAP